jgi:hypothetical protein
MSTAAAGPKRKVEAASTGKSPNKTKTKTETSPVIKKPSEAVNGSSERKKQETKDSATTTTAKPESTHVPKTQNDTLVSSKVWDVYSPPPSNSLKGKVVPRVLNRFKNRRKISIEVHKITPISTVDRSKKNKSNAAAVASYDECVVR